MTSKSKPAMNLETNPRKMSRHSEWSQFRADRWTLDVVIGAAVGIVVGLAALGPARLFGETSLTRAISGDAGSSFAGLRFFVNDGWHFPLLETSNLTSVAGDHANIALTDGIPLLAIIAKTFKFLGISTETWIGLWYYGCFLAQGIAAGICARVFSVSSRWTTFAFAVFAVTAPVLLLRIWHPGLLGQFTILLIWAAIGNLWRNPSMKSALWGIPVLILSLSVHPYFFAMNSFMFGAAIWSCLFEGSLVWKQVLVWLGSFGSVALLFMVVMGYLQSGVVPPGGYGELGVHLLGPIWPQWSTLWPGDEWLLLNRQGSFEGVNYLGAGVVVALFAATLLRIRAIFEFILKRQVFVVALVLVTLFAVTHVVHTWNSQPFLILGEDRSRVPPTSILLVVGLGAILVGLLFVREVLVTKRLAVLRPATLAVLVFGAGVCVMLVIAPRSASGIIQQFRASGRFFWIVGYGLSLGSLVWLDRWFAERVAPRRDHWRAMLATTMALLALLQFVDTSRYRSFVPEMLGSDDERVANIDLLASQMSGFDQVRIAPAYYCTDSPEALMSFQDAVIAASLADTPINGYYGGRADEGEACATTVDLGGGGRVLAAVVSPLDPTLSGVVPPGFTCRRFTDEMPICSE